jgi:hypothetical protein
MFGEGWTIKADLRHQSSYSNPETDTLEMGAASAANVVSAVIAAAPVAAEARGFKNVSSEARNTSSVPSAR